MPLTQRIQLISISVLILGGIFMVLFFAKAPADFPVGARFQVGEGESLVSISHRLKDSHLIRSSLLFRALTSASGKDKQIGLGTYIFSKKASIVGVTAKMAKGPDEPLLSVTIPEGYTTQEIAASFKKAIPALDEDIFVQKVSDEKLNGYLFPSTYYPLPSFNEDDIITKMKATFDKEYTAAFSKASYPKYVPTQEAVVTLASILEGEAKTEEDMRLVSGILQKRLALGMRLQVDVAPSTYKKTGIPSDPVGNPGIMAMKAVFDPLPSSYMYYLTGKDGKMYYAKTYDEHKKNIAKYLR